MFSSFFFHCFQFAPRFWNLYLNYRISLFTTENSNIPIMSLRKNMKGTLFSVHSAKLLALESLASRKYGKIKYGITFAKSRLADG